MIKWYEESDAEVNRSIALITGENPEKWYPYGGVKGKDYCKNPADAWPIICANKISLNAIGQDNNPQWQASITTQGGEWQAGCNSPLRAAMICFLLSRQTQEVMR